jgi:dienelactone hydrolase
MPKKGVLLIVMLCGVCLAACSSAAATPASSLTPTEIRETKVPTQTATAVPSTATPVPSATPTPSLTPTVIYSPEPRTVEFEAQDGQVLHGTYYPSSQSPAPVIVLMHWALGDQTEWTAVARWLQNRGAEGPDPDDGEDWLNPEWFPELPEDLAPAVFTFTFRSCQKNCTEYPAGDWLLDARAAMDTASRLEGVDRDRVLAAGASIGADGAVDGCYWMNAAQEGTCLGAFALSPGSYLTVPYEDAAHELLKDQPARTLWCLHTKRDKAALNSCRSVSGGEVVDFGPRDLHGLELINSDLEPSALDHLIQFIESSLAIGQ